MLRPCFELRISFIREVLYFLSHLQGRSDHDHQLCIPFRLGLVSEHPAQKWNGI